MNTEMIIGSILIALVIFGIPVVSWIKNLWLMIDCLLHGGDWEYYRDEVVAGLIFFAMTIGFIMFIYGLWKEALL